jgi:hypothetical protein
MRRPILTIAIVTALSLCLTRGRAEAEVDVHINLGFPPPPPVVFHHEPEVILVPETNVYYVPGLDYDFYRYGTVWYINRGGYWYSASSYRGPFTAIVHDRVPDAIIASPVRYRHHPARPPHWREDRGHGQGHGKGDKGDKGHRGRGHGHGRDK